MRKQMEEKMSAQAQWNAIFAYVCVFVHFE